MVTTDSLSRLLLLLYEGAATPERMQVFLSELANTMNARAARSGTMYLNKVAVYISKRRLSSSVSAFPQKRFAPTRSTSTLRYSCAACC